MEGPNRPAGEPDNWWWLTLLMPDGTVHLYELGYAQLVDVLDDRGAPTGEKTRVLLSDERNAEILAEIGQPAEASMAPGRPNRYLEPRERDADGNLLPIRARDGVTLHLLAA